MQQILITNTFLEMHRNCTNEPCSFLTINTTLHADNPMRFRKNFSDSKRMTKIKKSLNTAMILFITLCITLINIVCPVLMKYHQLTLNLIQ